MGGREAVRGFAIQTLICLLDAVAKDADWIAVTVEPDSANDKVDILWEYEGRRKAVQVKSSQNPIGAGAIEGWCKKLEMEVADEYELRLAGPLMSKALSGNFGKVSVPAPTSIVISDLNDQAIARLDRYLEQSGIELVPGSIRTALVDICATKLIDGSSTGKRLERKEFDGWLLHWITAAYPDAVAGRLSSNCEVLWSNVRLVSPPTGTMAFEVATPLVFFNSGRGAAVVEWAIVIVEASDRRMIYGSRFEDINGQRRACSDFAVGAGQAMERTIVYRPFERPGLATDAWPMGENRLSLRIKFMADDTPRLVKVATLKIGGDHMQLLSKPGALEIPISGMEDYVFKL